MDTERLWTGTFAAWLAGTLTARLSGSAFSAAVVIVVVVTATLLLVGPEENRLAYGLTAGALLVVAGAIAPVFVTEWEPLTAFDSGFRLVVSVVVGVVVFVGGVAGLNSILLPAEDH